MMAMLAYEFSLKLYFIKIKLKYTVKKNYIDDIIIK